MMTGPNTPLSPMAPITEESQTTINGGNERVVYVREAGETDDDGHPKGTFCGVMTHTGASDSASFVLCTSP